MSCRFYTDLTSRDIQVMLRSAEGVKQVLYTPVSGAFAFEPVPAGRYWLEVTDRAGVYRPAARSLDLHSSEQWQEAITLAPVGLHAALGPLAAGDADVGANLYASTSTAIVGELITFTLQAYNDGPSLAEAVHLTQTLPVSFTVVSTPPACTVDALEVRCSLGSMDVYSDTTLLVTGRPQATGSFPSTLVVSTSSPDPYTWNNETSRWLYVYAPGTADLDAYAWVEPDHTLLAGSPFTYTLQVSNFGPGTADTVTATITLSGSVGSLAGGSGCGIAGSSVVCSGGPLTRNTSTEFTVTGVAAGLGTVTIEARATSSATDPGEWNNSATDILNVFAPGATDLQLSKWGACCDTPLVGQPYTYTVQVSNRGPSVAAGVAITDILPAELEFVSLSDPLCSYNAAQRKVTCSVGELAVYNSFSFDLVARPTAAGTLTNQAGVSLTSSDPITSNKTASHYETFVVDGAADLWLRKSIGGGIPKLNRPLTYTLEIGNEGPYAAQDVVITDTLPVSATFVSASAGCTYTAATHAVTCTIGSVDISWWQTQVSRTVVIEPTAAGTLVNMAAVGAPNYDSDTANNSSSVTSVVPSSATSGIAGTVRSQAGAALTNIQVQVLQQQPDGSWSEMRTVTTDLYGEYYTGPLDTALYRLRFLDPAGVYAFEYYNDQPNLANAADIPVVGDLVPNIDAVLGLGGSITGSVQMYDGQQPPYLYASIYQYDGADWRFLFTQWPVLGSGSPATYTINGLATGLYRISVWTDYQGATYSEFYSNATDINTATDIAVTAGSPTPNINLVLGDNLYTGRISGRVTSAGGPLTGIRLDLYQDAGWGSWWRLVYATTGADGRYTIGGLRDGSYRVRFVDPSGVLASIYYNGKADFAGANTIAISGQNQVDNINGDLSGAGAIAGQVSLSGGGFAGGLEVIAYRSTGADWEALGRASTDAAGSYRIGGLLAGAYRIYFADRSNTHRPEYYNNAISIEAASDVLVTASLTTENINALLELPEPPAIAVASHGASVTADPATGLVTVMTTSSQRSDTTVTRAVACASGVTPGSVQLLLNGTSYPMSPTAPGLYAATIPAANIATGNLSVSWQCAATPQEVVVGRIVLYDPSGAITDRVTGSPISGASVTLYRVPNWLPDTDMEQRNCRTANTRSGPDWSSLPPADVDAGVMLNPAIDAAGMSPAVNPQTTNDQGRYGWDVAEGCYYVLVSAHGYRTLVSPIVGVPPAVTDLNLALEPDAAAPVAGSDTATTPEDTTVEIPVLNNDQDANGDPLAVVAVAASANGKTSSNGVTLTYTPALNFNGAAVLTYTVSDGNFTDTGRVTVTVTPVNDAPVAADDVFTAAANIAGSIPVLANDSDVDGDALSVQITAAPAHGAATVAANGAITYVGAAGYAGADQLTYSVTDAGGLSATATVHVTVANAGPTAADDAASTPEDTAVTIPVLNNDQDENGDPLSVVAAGSDGHGAVAVQGSTLLFTPALNFNGTAVLTYTVSDGHANDGASVTVTVKPVNDAPVAVDDVVTAVAGAASIVSVLDNDSDVDGHLLTVQITAAPAHGAATVAGGSITYVAEAGYAGADQLTYSISDQGGLSATATVAITVTPDETTGEEGKHIYLPLIQTLK